MRLQNTHFLNKVLNFFFLKDPFRVWSGGYVSAGLSLLTCVAINGYHSQSSYTWKCGDTILAGQTTPLLYCTTSLSHECIVKCTKFDVHCVFTIQGKSKNTNSNNKVQFCLIKKKKAQQSSKRFIWQSMTMLSIMKALLVFHQ